MKIKNFIKRPMAIILSIVILSTATIGTIVPIMANNNETKGDQNISSEDRSTASEISNMTGFTIEEVISQKTKGKTWNQVLQKLKKVGAPSSKNNMSKTENLLLRNSLSEEELKNLKNNGFSSEEIDNAVLLAERVEFQLNELSEKLDTQVKGPDITALAIDKSENDSEQYKSLKDNFDVKTAVYLMLKLSKEFGSLEKVMDEYLLSLQLQIDMESYILDKKTYLKDKEEKLRTFDIQKAITFEKIDEAVNKKSTKKSENAANNKDNISESYTPPNTKNSLQIAPVVPKPDVKSVIPENPTESVLKEISDLEAINN